MMSQKPTCFKAGFHEAYWREANALGVSSPTIRNYIGLLSGTYMVVPVLPYLNNPGKRLVKTPRPADPYV